MMRRILFVMAATCALGAGPALADFAQGVVSQLRDMGYSRVVVERTWLGRVKIDAEGDSGRREIIINPRTGEILRDLYWPVGAGGSGQLLGGRSNWEDGDGGGDRDDGTGDDRDDDTGGDSVDDRDDDTGGDDSSGSGSGGDDDDSGSSGGDDDDDDNSGSSGGDDDSADDD